MGGVALFCLFAILGNRTMQGNVTMVTDYVSSGANFFAIEADTMGSSLVAR